MKDSKTYQIYLTIPDNKVSNLEWVSKSENEIHKQRELGKKNKPLYGEKATYLN